MVFTKVLVPPLVEVEGNEPDIGHPEVRFQKGIDDEGQKGGFRKGPDPTHQEGRFPEELDRDPDEEETEDAIGLLLGEEGVYDKADITHQEEGGHYPMIFARRPSGRNGGGARSQEDRGHEPPYKKEEDEGVHLLVFP